MMDDVWVIMFCDEIGVKYEDLMLVCYVMSGSE